MQKNLTTQNYRKISLGLRKTRTRTLIQIGGLVDKSGLTSMFEIEPGDDLQSDIFELDKAAALLGFLVEMADNNYQSFSDKHGEWMRIGQRLLKSPPFRTG